MPGPLSGPALTPSDVGRLVTVRARLEAGPADVVGTLLAVSATETVVRRRDGSVVTIPTAAVTHARLVPPGPAQTVGVDELERLMVDGWRPLETEPLGDWLLRASGGFTRRANSCLPVGEPGLPLGAAVDRVEGWYDARGLPPRMQVPGAGSGELVSELDRRGWHADVVVHVMTAELGPVLRSGDTGAVDVALDDAPDEAWLAAYRQATGPLPAGARELLTNHPLAVFASVRDAGACVAIARATADGRWAGLFAVEVAPSHRRHGLGRAVSIAALRWAAQRGARRAYLQAERDNAAAVTLYGALGFAVHHDYVHYTDRKSRAPVGSVET